MNRLSWLLLSGCLWAAMMFLLFEREIRPYFEYQQPPSYRQMFRDRREAEVQRRSIHLGAQKIGEAETLTEPLPEGGFRMTSRVLLRTRMLAPTPLPDDRSFISSTLLVDSSYQLARFGLEVRYQGIRIDAAGRREGETLRLTYDANLLVRRFQGEQVVDLPKDATLTDTFLPYQGGARLTVGKKWKMRVLDLENLFSLKGKRELSFTEVYATVVGREPVKSRGRDVLSFKIEVRKNPTDELAAYSIWVDEEGTVLRQEWTEKGYPCSMVLEERRRLAPSQGASYEWNVRPPE